MAIVSVPEAAKLTGKSAKTLYRWASHGRLSLSEGETGAKTVDTAELLRVFGPLKGHAETDKVVSMSARETELETRVRTLETELAAKDRLLESQEKNLTDLRQAMRLLECPKKRRWLFW